MDVVFPLGSGSAWDNNEIRYSVRSYLRFCRGSSGRIFIIGDDPGVFRFGEKIAHIPYAEPPEMPIATRIWEKLRTVALDPRISDEFFLMNDDFFFLKEFDTDSYPFYSRGTLDSLKYLVRPSRSGYRTNATRTLMLMRERGYSDHHFGVHAPIRINKRKFLECYACFADLIGTGWLLPRLTYGNYCDLKPSVVVDFKMNRFSEADLGKQAIFSIGALAHRNTNLDEFFEAFLPEASPFENMKTTQTDKVMMVNGKGDSHLVTRAAFNTLYSRRGWTIKTNESNTDTEEPVVEDTGEAGDPRQSGTAERSGAGNGDQGNDNGVDTGWPDIPARPDNGKGKQKSTARSKNKKGQV